MLCYERAEVSWRNRIIVCVTVPLHSLDQTVQQSRVKTMSSSSQTDQSHFNAAAFVNLPQCVNPTDCSLLGLLLRPGLFLHFYSGRCRCFTFSAPSGNCGILDMQFLFRAVFSQLPACSHFKAARLDKQNV